jgi:chromosome segregation ATPase
MQIVMNSIKTLGDELKKVEIGREKVADQYMPVINDAKSTLLTAIDKETSEQLPEIRSFDDVLVVRERTNRLLNRLGDTSGSHRRVIHSFFGKYSKVLKYQLGLMNKEVKHLNELIEEYTEKTSSLSECKTSISRIDMALKESSELVRKSEETRNELVTLKAREVELVRRIDNMQNMESFGEYKTNKEELGKVRKDAEHVLSEINAAFSKISRPVNKYTYEVGLDKESNYLVQSVMEDSSKLVHNAKVEQLVEVLNKVKGAVQQGKIVVKNPDKDIENINSLIANVHQYIDAYKGHYDIIQALSAKTSPIDAELDSLHKELERIRSDVRQKETFLNDYIKKIELAKSTINSELDNIAERIDRITGSRIKVTI